MYGVKGKEGFSHLRKIRDYLIILLILIFLIANSSQVAYKPATGKAFRLTMKVTYENMDRERIWNLTENDRIISLFMNNSWQTVYLVSSSHRIERFDVDSDGNMVAILNITKEFILPGEKISYNVTYELIFRERSLPSISEEESGTLNDIPKHLCEEYCRPTSLWRSNMSVLNETAWRIAGNETKVLMIIKKLVKWIAENINYDTSELPRYPNETLFTGLGDCDDQANLLITFCRAIGIPAYLQIGCIYIERRDEVFKRYWSGHLWIRQIRVGWHGWAIVYIPPWGWLPVDLTYVEGNLKENPLNSIVSSAIVKHYTFQYINIIKTDYVAETMSLKSFLEAHEFYIYEEDEMKEMTSDGSLVVKPIIITDLNMFTRVVTFIRQRGSRCE
ncbi:MAG: transglutaminase-like domain-containing protein [Candidatus Bathyarchaeia archaeon]